VGSASIITLHLQG